MNKRYDIDWVHHDSKTFDEEKFMEDIEREYIKQHTTHIKGYTEEYVNKLKQEINRLNNIIDELEKVFIECDYQHLQRKLKSLKENNKE